MEKQEGQENFSFTRIHRAFHLSQVGFLGGYTKGDSPPHPDSPRRAGFPTASAIAAPSHG